MTDRLPGLGLLALFALNAIMFTRLARSGEPDSRLPPKLRERPSVIRFYRWFYAVIVMASLAGCVLGIGFVIAPVDSS